MTRVLFIRFSSIGDVVLTAPAVAAFREVVDGPVEVHYLVRSAFALVVEGFGELVDVIHTVDRSGSEALPVLRAIGFDHVIDLQANVRSRAITRGLGLTSTFRVNKQNWAKWALINGLRSQGVSTIVERYVQAFAPAFYGVKCPESWPNLFDQATLPFGFRGDAPWCVLALGAAHSGKAIPVELFQALIDASPLRVVLIGGDQECGLAGRLHHAESWVGKTTILESAAILRGAFAVVSGDSGMMHVAAAVGTPVLALWGCTRPSLGMAAWKPAGGSIDVLPVGRGDSKPCSKLGNRCRYGNDAGCTRHLPIPLVLDKWARLLDSNQSNPR